MTHVKDLHLSIPQKVFVCYVNGLVKGFTTHEFKQLLPPAAVCRVWRECMLPYVYCKAYLECHIKKADKRKKKRLLSRFRSLTRRLNEADADKKNAQPRYEWKSNIDVIVSQGLSSAIRHLSIKSSGCSPKCSDMIHALDALGFSSSYWRAVNALQIHISLGVAVNESKPSSGDDEALASQLTEYFGRHLPNIGDLLIQIVPQSNASQLLSNKLVNFYISQLYSLVCYPDPITFSCHSFSSRLRHLRASIASGVTNRLPQLLASPLEKLELFDIPHNFAWWIFVGSAPGHIEFTNLTHLRLQFRQQLDNAEEPNNSNKQMSTSTVSLNIGCRKLFFPKLKELIIGDSPYNDGALYSMFVHSPLQTVKILSSFKSVQHMDPHILSSAADVRFDIYSVPPNDYNDYVEFYCKLLGTPSNARAAKLSVPLSSLPLPIPSTIEWVHLEDLTLAAKIHLVSVIQVITQLPKLHKLEVENVVDEVNEAGANLQAILEGRLTQTPSIATNLKHLQIYRYAKQPLAFMLDVIRYLAILVHSLDEIAVPDFCFSDINEFAVHSANMFPHLRNIKVRHAA